MMEEVSYQRLLGVIVERLEVGVFAVDRDYRIVLWNRYLAMHSGKTISDIQGKNLFSVFPEIPELTLRRKMETVFNLGNYAFSAWEQRPYLFKFKHNRPITGGVDAMRQNATFIPVKNQQGQVRLVVVTLSDVTDVAWIQKQLVLAIEESNAERLKQKELIEKLEEAKSQLFQSEKMASIGQLAAGVAHEINNPIGFVNSNLGSLARGMNDFLELIDTYESMAENWPPEIRQQLKEKRASLDFDFLREDMSAMIRESKEGLDHVRRIVGDLKDFSRVDQSGWQTADIEKCLDTTLNVAANELKYRATIVRNYAHPSLIECVPGQINQVLMNLLVNAAQAFSDRGTITLSTGESDDFVWVEVADDGEGISEENLSRIFDPFFTTKPVGQGTGLGLSVCYNIVRKHHGDLSVKSQLGVGSTFRLTLPIRQSLESVDETEENFSMAGT